MTHVSKFPVEKKAYTFKRKTLVMITSGSHDIISDHRYLQNTTWHCYAGKAPIFTLRGSITTHEKIEQPSLNISTQIKRKEKREKSVNVWSSFLYTSFRLFGKIWKTLLYVGMQGFVVSQRVHSMTLRNRTWPASAGGLACSLPSYSSALTRAPSPDGWDMLSDACAAVAP